jgi:hypothetical protein
MLVCFCLLMVCLSALGYADIKPIGRSSETLGETGNIVRSVYAAAPLSPTRIGLMELDWRSVTAPYLTTPLILLLQNKN